jgi:uncharacterized protein DUF5996
MSTLTAADSQHDMTHGDRWPALELDEWLPTQETLHRWLQIVGKTRLALSPFENHWWHTALYVTAHGVTTSAMPYSGGMIDIELDVLRDMLVARTSVGENRSIRLESKTVAAFYAEYRAMLAELGVEIQMSAAPNEIADATPFARDEAHATYDADAARRWWIALRQANRLLKQFRSRFGGKCSPSHLWWGALDIACTRFSGRTAPKYAGTVPNCPEHVMHEAYSHECISAGWWPGTVGSPVAYPAFYAYAYPEPDGCPTAAIAPAEASYQLGMREWILPYDSVRASSDPDAMVLDFLQSTYDAAARLGGWDTNALRSSAR